MSKLRLRTTLKGFFLFLVICIAFGCALRTSGQTTKTAPHSARIDQGRLAINHVYGQMALHFEANLGQTDEQVKFLTRGRGYAMFLTANEAVVTLRRPDARGSDDRHLAARRADPRKPVKQTVIRMSFPGANPNPRMEGRERLAGKANYFRGKDPAKWRANVPTYARVRYEDLYPGIDLMYYGNHRQLEYDFVVQPGADPSRIALEFKGAEKMEVDVRGDLVLHTPGGEIKQHKPFIYQEVDGERREISGGYVLRGDHQVGVRVSAYDATQTLVIDPILVYSTHLGGSDFDDGFGIALDDASNAYITGETASADFPTTAGAFDTTFSGSEFDAYVTKLNSTGSGLVYSTYLSGTNGSTIGAAIAVDGSGNAYAMGTTTANDFPTTAGAFDTSSNGGEDTFIAKLNPTGSALVYSTFLGGSSDDFGFSVDLDATGAVYVTGGTASADFPTTAAAFDVTFNGGPEDVFVAKLDPTGSALAYSTYLGGTDDEFGDSISLDAGGNAYVGGFTNSTNFPLSIGAFDTIPEDYEGFVTKLDPTGSALIFSTYLGGSGLDVVQSIALDAVGNAFLIGRTDSPNFPITAGAFQSASGGNFDAFVTKLNSTGSGLVYSTYLGGSDFDIGGAVAVDDSGRAHVAGLTFSIDFPVTADAFQPMPGGGGDIFVTKLNPAGTALVYSSYLGGNDLDVPSNSIALDTLPVPNLYLAGSTRAWSNFPTTPGAFSPTFNGGGSDAIVVQIADVPVAAGPFTERVTGGGTIDVPPPGGIGTFHFIIQRASTGELSGRLQYINHVSGARVVSETYSSLTIVGNTATFDGDCTVGGAPCTFLVNVTDNGEPGTTDTFTISVSGGPTEGGVLRSGNILIQQ